MPRYSQTIVVQMYQLHRWSLAAGVAVPVTLTVTVPFAAAAGVLGLLAQTVYLDAVALDLLRAVEQSEDTVAPAEREARPGEVVAGIGLDEAAGAVEC